MKKWPLLYEVRTVMGGTVQWSWSWSNARLPRLNRLPFPEGSSQSNPFNPGQPPENAIGVWASAISVYIPAQISPRVGCSRDHAEHPTDIECSVKTSLEWCRLHLNYLGVSAIALQRQ